MKILLVRPKKFKLVSWIIMKIEKSQGSHLCFHWWSDYFQRNIYFTTELLSGSSLENAEHMKKYEIVQEWNINPTPEADLELKRNFIDSLHVQYGVLKLFYILIKRVFGVTVKSKTKDKFQICSENIVRMLDYKKELKSYDGIGLKEAVLLLENNFMKEN